VRTGCSVATRARVSLRFLGLGLGAPCARTEPIGPHEWLGLTDPLR